MKSYLLYSLVILQILLFTGKQAHADEYWSFVEAHCVPSMGLFTIKTFSEYNLPGINSSDTENLEKVEKSDGIFLLSRFANKISSGDKVEPFNCQLERGMKPLKVSIYVGAHKKPSERGQCGGVEWATLVVKVDDIEIAQMGAGYSCNEEMPRSSIIVNAGMNTIEQCNEYKGLYIEPSSGFKPVKEECKVTKLEQKK